LAELKFGRSKSRLKSKSKVVSLSQSLRPNFASSVSAIGSAEDLDQSFLPVITVTVTVTINGLVKLSENESGDWIHRVRGPPGHMVIVRMRKV